jgi:hypothetical protein
MNTPGARTAERRQLLGLVSVVAVVVGLLDFLSQVVLRRELAPGEFGTVNAVLGVVAILTAPVLALALVPYRGLLSPAEVEQWTVHRPALTRLATFGWGGVSLVLLFAALPFLSLPGLPLQMFAVLATAAMLAARLSATLCHATGRMRLLTALLIIAALVRLGISAVAGHYQPVAQSGIGAVILAAALVALPALQDYDFPALGVEGRHLLRKLVVPLLATASVVLALALFTNVHRVVAQSNFGAPDPTNLGFVNPQGFDDFQAAALIARGVLTGTLALLAVFGLKRAALESTTLASLRGFWIYLGALVGGVVLLVAAAPLANVVFTGNPAAFLPGFAGAVFMLGLLQGAGVFALASRRWAECFVLGACSIAYTIFLFYGGYQPALLTSCMFGGSLISLMLVLFVGVIRYARSHP